jgi:VanZ family protein
LKINRYLARPVPSLTLCIGMLIVLSSLFMRQVMLFVRSLTGSFIFELVVSIILIIIALTFIIYIVKICPQRIRCVFIIILVTGGLVLTSFISIPEEKVHIIEFALLGWFAMSDFSKKNSSFHSIILSIIICSLFGIFDEIVQGILPYRFFDIRDIVFNMGGGIWGTIVYYIHYSK